MQRFFIGCLLVLGSAASAHGQDGAQLASEKGCVACHGLDGVSVAPSYPNLAGQWEDYLRLQLLAYRSGKRKNAVMAGFAGSLTDEEIRALAKHYGE